MANRRSVLKSRTSLLAIVAAGKGGVGKTTLATLIADEAALADHPLSAFQVDDQRRLEAMLGARVHTIAPDYEAALRSPRALTSPFAPFYNACAEAGRGGPSGLLDVGANRVELVTLWMRRAEIGEDLAAWGIKPVVFVRRSPRPNPCARRSRRSGYSRPPYRVPRSPSSRTSATAASAILGPDPSPPSSFGTSCGRCWMGGPQSRCR